MSLCRLISGVFIQSVISRLGFFTFLSEMADVRIIDLDEDSKDPKINGCDRPRKPQKRKRASLVPDPPNPEEKAAQIEALREELDGLFKYYKEVMDKRVYIDLAVCNSSNAVVAALMEESALPLSKLVEDIYEKLKGNGVTLASVKSTVLFVGQRVTYGVPNAEADVLEDESDAGLWCWEVMVSGFSCILFMFAFCAYAARVF